MRAITELQKQDDVQELLNTRQYPSPYPHLFQILHRKHGKHKYVQTTTNITKQAIYVKCNTEARSGNHYWRGKAVCIRYSECVSLALGIQHAKRMRRFILSYVACLGFNHIFLHYDING